MHHILFPFNRLRPIQDKLLEEVCNALIEKHNLVVHAPTGIGKTCATLSPAIQYALENDLIVFFLTSKHTQHRIAIDTLKRIRLKAACNFNAVDIIGKRWMCPLATQKMSNEDFHIFCRKLREEQRCEFFSNVKARKGFSARARALLSGLRDIPPIHCQELVALCKEKRLCAYEIAVALAKTSRAIVADYYHMLSPQIRQSFLKRIERKLDECILIFDEGHNLPERARNILSARLSMRTIERARSEARTYGFKSLAAVLKKFMEYCNKLVPKKVEETKLERSAMLNCFESEQDIHQLMVELELLSANVYKEHDRSAAASLLRFFDRLLDDADVYVRFASSDGVFHQRCLDASLLTKALLPAHNIIIMSGTLTPTEMYADLLGLSNCKCIELPSPFPNKNRLNLIIPETTTRFRERSNQQYAAIGSLISRLLRILHGNTMVFFPSYAVRDAVYPYIKTSKRIFIEKQGMTKEEKESLLELFKSEGKNSGSVLLCIATANFSESVDLPGQSCQCIIVVGIPMQKPDIETRALIDFFEKRYGKGWDYGYVYPAIRRCLQSAGRCIRSEHDKGIIIFLDKRFSWPRYMKCFPPDMNFRIITSNQLASYLKYKFQYQYGKS